MVPREPAGARRDWPTYILDERHRTGAAALLLIDGILLAAGMILHSAAAIVLLVPILLPLTTELGLDPIHFGLMVTVSLAIGQQTPPVASVLITTCSIADVPMWEVMRVNIYFILALAVVLLLVTFFPSLSLFLPELLSAEP